MGILAAMAALLVAGFSLGLIAGSGPTAPSSTSPAPRAAQSEYARCGWHGIFEDGACVCFDCWTGDACADATPLDACVVAAAGGTPLLFEDYWTRHADEATLSLPPSYHIGYGARIGCGDEAVAAGDYRVPGVDPACDALAAAVRRVHALVGNADARRADEAADGFYVVLGVGSTELIAAAMWALADDDAREPALVWSAGPYYVGYEGPATFFNSSRPRFRWLAPEHHPEPPSAQAAAGRRVIEYVTSPNNPDGALRAPRVSGAGARAVFDSAYFWPHFTPISAPRTAELGPSDVALFTLSKLTGHAGTRIGWAITRDASVAARLHAFVRNAGDIPRENQQRALAVLTHLADQGPGGALLGEALEEMSRRWGALEALFGGSRCYAPQGRGPALAGDAWSDGASRQPTPAYVWFECRPAAALADDETCFDRVLAAGVKGLPGHYFGDDSGNFMRLELLMRAQAFDLMMQQLEKMQGAC